MKRILGLLAVAALALTGCGGEPEPTPEPTVVETTPEPTPEPTTPPPPPPVWPLTGEPQDTATVNPVVGVKVENSAPARPWEGLVEADIVFVEMVEGGLTRFHAVYNSSFPEVIGPVRSLRPMDAGILGMWDATLFASGGQTQFVDQVRAVADVRMEGDPAYFRAYGGRYAPHNLMLEIGRVYHELAVGDAVIPMFEYSETPSATAGTEMTDIHLAYPGTSSDWWWNAEQGVFLRSDTGTESVEADGTRITASNVVVLEVTTQNTGAIDASGASVPETILVGSGSLHVFTGGSYVTGTWEKAGTTDPFVFTDEAGVPITITPGTTWVELLPTTGSLTINEPAPAAAESETSEG